MRTARDPRRLGLGVLFVLSLVPWGGALPAQERFSVADVLSSPFPSALVAAPDGDLVAWVEDERGARNVWVAAGPDFRPRRITAYEGDDGQELGSLQVTPDLLHVIYVRGGAPNRNGEIPNPVSVATGVERAAWIVPVAGGEPRKLADGAVPVLSPDGSRVAYTASGAVWILGLEEGATAREVARPRGGAGSLAWSPDGARLAFVSTRGDHAFVGVIDPDAGTLLWLDPSVDRDGSPAWSPDGSRVAFVRVPNARARLPFSPQREAHPWSIRVAHARTGVAREAWRSEVGAGSAFYGVDGENLLWMAGDRLVFPWERDGWLHLYSVPAAGGRATLLTPGPFEIQGVRPSPERARVLYDSNQDDVDRKHVWEVPSDGSRAPRPLTSGEGLEWGAVETAGGTLAYMASGARAPARVHVAKGDGTTAALTELPRSFPAASLVEPRAVVFPAADGMAIHGQLFLPPDLSSGEGEARRPAVIFFHGGSRRQMLLGFHPLGYYHNAYAFNQLLASRGYVVLSVNYRSGIGYGMEFREALDYGATGASEFNDVLGAGLYLASRPDVDPARIALWGGSYGGYLTALGLARASDLFAAGVDLHGVHDWNVVIKNFVPSYVAEAHPGSSELAFRSSPMAWIGSWRSPVLLIHGDDDRNVPFSESVELAESLRGQGVEFEQLVFPDEVHGFLLHRSWVRAFEAARDFLERKLGSPYATTPPM